MWWFSQTTGHLSVNGDKPLVTGYAGAGKGKNNPEMQSVHNEGPLPIGLYTIDAPIDTDTHGPYVLRLEPHPSNEMFGRDGFLMHGDSIKHPGTASLGCIVVPRWARQRVWESGDRALRVVKGDEYL